MKTTYKYGIHGYRGKLDGLVLYYDRLSDETFARRYVYPRLTDENERIGSISRQIFALAPSEAYQSDLKLYRTMYNALPGTTSPLRSWASLYTLLMYRLANAMPQINLRTITREEVYENDYPCISIKKAVQSELLPEVPGWENLDKELW